MEEMDSSVPASGGQGQEMAATDRGSDKMMRLRGRRAISDEHLKRLASMTDMDGVRILDWFPLGTPDIEVVYGTFRLEPKMAGQFLDRFLELEEFRVRKWEVFPYGVVAIDELVVRGEIVAGMGG